VIFLTFDLIKDKNKHVHFIGVGGISMSGLAQILLKNGFCVSGSDMKLSPIVQKLIDKGLIFHQGHNKDNVVDADMIVYTAAISNDNPELMMAKEKNIPTINRAVFLGELMKSHKYNIAISGTHGKTTTTSMVSHIFMEAKLEPTILIGGELDLIGGNVYTGKSDYFITEACEYKESFLSFYPYVGIILNIDADHLDYYKDINAIEAAFLKFAKLIPQDGYLIGCADDSRVVNVMNSVSCNKISYGIKNGDIKAINITFNDNGCASFDVAKDDSIILSVELSVPGKHNVLNALSSIASSIALNVPYASISEGLMNFKGAHKRFEFKGEKNGITVIDDYAHHPTEIKALLSAAKTYPHKRIICAFQPHTYTRTLTLFNEFCECFDDADEIVLADIYAAREQDTGVISSVMLGDKLRERKLKCTNFHSFDEITDYLKSNLTEGDLLLTVGAGEIVKVGEDFLQD
jgi:UDP-N-acetylmuramate--alanine ligase